MGKRRASGNIAHPFARHPLTTRFGRPGNPKGRDARFSAAEKVAGEKLKFKQV